MKVNDITLSASDLGAVLGGLTARRIRQLAEEGAFPRAGRGEFPLVQCVNAYIANMEGRNEPDDIRAARLRLLKAQAQRLELQNAATADAQAGLDWQAAVADVLCHFVRLRLQPLPTWLFNELSDKLDGQQAREVAGTASQWLVGALAEAEQAIADGTARMRARGIIVTSHDDFARIVAGEPIDSEGEAADGC